MNGACLKTWSTTQSVIARSSGEAEYCVVVKGPGKRMALQSMMEDLCLKVTVVAATAALAEGSATGVVWGSSGMRKLHSHGFNNVCSLPVLP